MTVLDQNSVAIKTLSYLGVEIREGELLQMLPAINQ